MFEDFLRKHGLEENSIAILIRNGITSTNFLLALDKDDVKNLDLNIGQHALMWKLMANLKASDGDEDEENISRINFWCLFKCLGGIGVVG